ncbi:hypothetical protein [Bacillus sp. REN10]|nr:hypothetical protein [Bacillus sp. REN10]
MFNVGTKAGEFDIMKKGWGTLFLIMALLNDEVDFCGTLAVKRLQKE